MRLEEIEAFIAVTETGSFQKAARLCRVTQSTISRQIQSLETQLGLPLFHRINPVRLTLGGERLLPHARKISQVWKTLREELDDLREGKQRELCVAAIHSVCAVYLPPILQQFCRDYPEVQLRVTALGSERALKVLKDGLVDVAIVMNNPLITHGSELLVEILYDESIEVLMSANHPLTKYERVPLSELGHYPQVVFKDGYGMQRLVQEQFTRLGTQLHAVLELNTLDAFRGVVRQGELIALLPHAALIDAYRDDSLAVRSIEYNPMKEGGKGKEERIWTRQVVIVTTTERILIPPIKHFWDLVCQKWTVEG